jgi:hypothetical protein
MTRLFVRAFSVFYSARSRSLSFPSSLFSFVLHLASLHDTYMAICVRALAGKMNRARVIGERTSEQTDAFSSFCLSRMYARTRTHCFLFSSRRRPMHRGYSISSLPSLSSPVYFYLLFIYERENEREKKKKRECQASYRTNARVRIWITTPFTFFSLCVSSLYEREKERRK